MDNYQMVPDAPQEESMQLTRRTKALLAAAAVAVGTLAMSAAATAAVSCFTDVDPGDWFFSYVCEAADAGIVTGYPDGTFDPDGTITRAEAAVIATRHLEESISHGEFVMITDGSEFVPYAADPVSGIDTWAGVAMINADGKATAPLSAPLMFDGVEYGLKSVSVCIESASGDAAIVEMDVWLGGSGNIGSDSTPFSSGCRTMQSNSAASNGAGIVIELDSTSGTDDVWVDYVKSVWAPLDELTPPAPIAHTSQLDN